MLSWLKNLLSKIFHRKKKSDLHVYKPAHRILYCYFDGEKEVKADPLALYKKFVACSKDLVPVMEQANVLATQGELYGKFVAKLRELFKVKEFEEGGLTDIEVLLLFDNFLEFCGAKKKEGEELKAKLEEEMGPVKENSGSKGTSNPNEQGFEVPPTTLSPNQHLNVEPGANLGANSGANTGANTGASPQPPPLPPDFLKNDKPSTTVTFEGPPPPPIELDGSQVFVEQQYPPQDPQQELRESDR